MLAGPVLFKFYLGVVRFLQMMLHSADSFIESVAAQAGQLAKLRGSSVLDAKDVAFVLGKDRVMINCFSLFFPTKISLSMLFQSASTA